MSTPSTQPQQPNAWGTKSNAWSVPVANGNDSAISLKDVMIEQQQLAVEVLEEDPGLECASGGTEIAESCECDIKDDGVLDTTNDELLALMLQENFDEESAFFLQDNEQKLNGATKDGKPTVEVNFEFDKRTFVDDDSESSDECETRAVDRFEEFEKSRAGLSIGRSGYVKQGNKVVSTKHDLETCGRRNAQRVMDFDLNVLTGDGGGFDMQLNNNVFNVLKVHSVANGKRMARLHEKKEKSTAEGVMDETSKLMIFKLINHGILDEVNGIVNTGKEANVYHGVGGNDELKITVGEVAIKIFKTTLSEFKNRDPYIKDDYRFKQRFSKQNPRKIINLWAEKEMHNLVRMRKEGLPCPEVVMLKKHVLVMTFIGSEGKPAPTLKESQLPLSKMQKAYEETVQIMKALWHKCNMVHADLSEYNLLWHEGKVWVIDVGQSVLHDHPNALEFLHRDCSNIASFFRRMGVDEVLSATELFTAVTDKDLGSTNADGVQLLTKIEGFERNKEVLTVGLEGKDGDAFDQMFERGMSQRNQVVGERNN